MNFQLRADGGSDFNFTDPNQLGTGGSGTVNVYGDAGTHSITVNIEGDWTICVVTTPKESLSTEVFSATLRDHLVRVLD